MTRSTRPRTTTAHIPLAVGEPAGAATRGAIIIAYAHCIEQGLLTKTGPAHQKAAVESVHFLLWTYNPTTGKVKLDSADKSDTVSFAYPPLVGGSRSARTHPSRRSARTRRWRCSRAPSRASRTTTPSSRSSPRCNSRGMAALLLLRGRSKRGAALVPRSRFLV